MSAIVTLTMNPAIDKSTTVDRVIPENKLRCGAPRYDPGGGGLNVSRAICQLGGESLAIYTAGGLSGQMLSRLLDETGFPHRAIPTAAATREDLHVCEESTGQQFRFNMPGATLTEQEWRSALDILAVVTPKPEYIVASGSLPPGAPEDFYARVVAVGNRLGARTIVDTNGIPLKLAAREGVFLLKPNFSELGHLAECAIEDESHIEAAAMSVMASFRCEAVAVSLGAAGVLMATREGCARIQAPAVRALSKVGAGDSMVAGTVLSLSRGMSLPEAVRFGVAAGTAAVMRPGTQLCRREDAERLYARMGAGGCA